MKRFLIIFIILFISGCKVGPNYREPCLELPTQFSENRPDQTYIPDDEELTGWWKMLGDPFLDELLEESITGSFDYRIAIQQVYQARAQYWMQFTQILPEFVVDSLNTRYRTSQAFNSTAAPSPIPISPTKNFFQFGFDAIWELDLFGKLRRSADAAYDSWESIAENARDVKITVLSEVARIYVQICALQEKKDLFLQLVNYDKQILDFFSDRFASGLNNDQDVMNAQIRLEQDYANLKIVEIQLKQSIYSLSTLLGRAPETLIESFSVKRPIPRPIQKVPSGIPADLLRRRHDIKSAERELAAATEQVGVAVAQLYPSISLAGSSSSFAANPLQGANIGYSTDQFSKLFTSPARIWGIGALITMPIFDFGQRLAGIEVQRALQEQAYLNYQKTVISALQEVEDAFTAYFNEEERAASLSVSVESQGRIYHLTQDLFQSGLADYTQVLQIKNSWVESRNLLIESKQQVMTNLIALYKSMGGDW